jgi:translocator protein
LISIVGLEVVGNIGTLATFSQITTWYAGLHQPSFSPPNWLFGPAWTILFALMGISIYLIRRAQTNNNREQIARAYKFFILQMALNVTWSFIFFGFHEPYAAFIEILVLWLAIIATILEFYPISKKAAWVLLPYLLWVSFASLLNYAVFRLN